MSSSVEPRDGEPLMNLKRVSAATGRFSWLAWRTGQQAPALVITDALDIHVPGSSQLTDLHCIRDRLTPYSSTAIDYSE